MDNANVAGFLFNCAICRTKKISGDVDLFRIFGGSYNSADGPPKKLVNQPIGLDNPEPAAGESGTAHVCVECYYKDKPIDYQT